MIIRDKTPVTAIGAQAVCHNSSMTESKPLMRLDVTGLNCPMPLLKAKQALNALQPGDHLEVVATDPGSVRDFEVFSAQSGHPLLDSREEGGRYYYLLEKNRPQTTCA